MKKRISFLIIFSVFVIIAVGIVTVICAREFTTDVYYTHNITEVTGTRYTTENDSVELKNVTDADGIVRATFVSKSIGFDTVTFYTETSDKNQDGTVELRFRSGPFGTIFCFNPLIDFEGSIYAIGLLMLLTAVFAVVLLYSFVDLIRKSEFGYKMVACSGVGLFCAHYLIVSIIELIGSFKTHYQFGLGNYLSQLAGSGVKFSHGMSIIMAVFCALLIISNLSLVRHEGYRLQNLLGVILGVLWLAGYVVGLFFEGKKFDDTLRIYASLSNGIAVVISYFECMLFSTVVSAFMASRNQPPLDRDYIIILGCAIRRDGSLTPILKGRVDAALGFAKKQLEETGRQIKFVPSGGQGSDEIFSEGEAMSRYLIDSGIDEKDILPEMKSVNTFENLKLSKEIMESDTSDKYNAAFATTNYHVFRGYILSKKAGINNVRGISSKTKWYFFPNAFLREFAGLMVDKWKLHILIILLILTAFTGIYYLI